MANRKDKEKANSWAEFRKRSPKIGWDTNINEIKYDELPGEDATFVENLVKYIQENWSLFLDNIEKLNTRTINRCNFVKEVEHIDDSICFVYLIIMSDATGGTKFALL